MGGQRGFRSVAEMEDVITTRRTPASFTALRTLIAGSNISFFSAKQTKRIRTKKKTKQQSTVKRQKPLVCGWDRRSRVRQGGRRKAAGDGGGDGVEVKAETEAT